VTTTPDMAKFLLNMPLVQIDSVGSGCGSFVRIDPNARRPEIGPDSPVLRVKGVALMAGVSVQRKPMPSPRRLKRR